MDAFLALVGYGRLRIDLSLWSLSINFRLAYPKALAIDLAPSGHLDG
jgi:hypothetical protein